MAALNHTHTSELEYVVDDAAGLGEFDSESGAPISLSRSPRGQAVLHEVGTFTVIEQYEPVDLVEWAAASGVAPWWAAMKTASAAVLVAITTGVPAGTGVLPERFAPPPVMPAVTVQVSPPPAETAVRPARRGQLQNGLQQPRRSPAAPPARTETASALDLASLRKAFASLNGPFMTFEHCEVRLASADRAIARCQGTRGETESGDGSPSRRRVEWTLDFDQAEERWLIVDATAL